MARLIPIPALLSATLLLDPDNAQGAIYMSEAAALEGSRMNGLEGAHLSNDDRSLPLEMQQLLQAAPNEKQQLQAATAASNSDVAVGHGRAGLK
jgi:hypothetical protein